MDLSLETYMTLLPNHVHKEVRDLLGMMVS